MNGDTGVLPRVAGAPMSVRRRALNRGLLRLPLPARRRAQYLLAHDRPLPLRHPRRWSEKVNWRMVFDRRDLIAMTCDKLASKTWVAQTIASDTMAVPRTAWAGTDLHALTDLAWPDSWVLKPNHGTGSVQLGHGTPDRERLTELASLARRWLTEPGPEIWGEWGYGRARRLIVLEEAVPGTPLGGRTDYKFFVTGGTVRLAYVESNRFDASRGRSFHTPEGRRVSGRNAPPAGHTSTLPDQWDDLVDLAGKLGAAFDAIRVDLYLEDGLAWFGELTAYDGSGLLRFPTPEIDALIGEDWDLPDLVDRSRRQLP